MCKYIVKDKERKRLISQDLTISGDELEYVRENEKEYKDKSVTEGSYQYFLTVVFPYCHYFFHTIKIIFSHSFCLKIFVSCFFSPNNKHFLQSLFFHRFFLLFPNSGLQFLSSAKWGVFRIRFSEN